MPQVLTYDNDCKELHVWYDAESRVVLGSKIARTRGEPVAFARLTPEEARLLSEMLTEIAGYADEQAAELANP